MKAGAIGFGPFTLIAPAVRLVCNKYFAPRSVDKHTTPIFRLSGPISYHSISLIAGHLRWVRFREAVSREPDGLYGNRFRGSWHWGDYRCKALRPDFGGPWSF